MRDGRHIAAVTNNALHVLTGETISMSRRGDLSTLVVTKAGWPWWISWLLGNGDAELLYVHYLNPTTVQARGIFGCSMHKLITVTDGQPGPEISCTMAALPLASESLCSDSLLKVAHYPLDRAFLGGWHADRGVGIDEELPPEGRQR